MSVSTVRNIRAEWAWTKILAYETRKLRPRYVKGLVQGRKANQ